MSIRKISPLTLLGRVGTVVAAALVLIAIDSAPARAGLVMSVDSVTAAAGSTNNTFDVILTNTGGSAVTIGGFAFKLTAGSGVTFTAVDETTTIPYIFAGNSLFGPDISNGSLPGSVLLALDEYSTFSQGASLGAGSSLALGDVHFNVGSGASGQVAITLAGYPDSNLSDANGIDITTSAGTTFTSGTVTVTSSAVPEPSSLAMLSLSVVVGLGYWKHRKKSV